MTCNFIGGGVVVCTGPEMVRCKTLEQASAKWCPGCKRRTVQTLVSYFPKMDDTMDDSAMLAAAFYGPEFRWECSCGADQHASVEVEW